eukprot:5357686-Pyramimonas_sp.AAC.1
MQSNAAPWRQHAPLQAKRLTGAWRCGVCGCSTSRPSWTFCQHWKSMEMRRAKRQALGFVNGVRLVQCQSSPGVDGAILLLQPRP